MKRARADGRWAHGLRNVTSRGNSSLTLGPAPQVRHFVTVKNDNNKESSIPNHYIQLYILRALKPAGVPGRDIINVYIALVRFVVEYCCVVCATSLLLGQNSEERLRILFPEDSYRVSY